MIDEERIEISENQLKEAKQMVEESDIKYDEVSTDDIPDLPCFHSFYQRSYYYPFRNSTYI